MTQAPTTPKAPASAASESFRAAWTLARVRDVPIRIDPSLLLIVLFVAIFFYNGFVPILLAESVAATGAAAALATVLFFASLLGHELGHCLTSLDRGIPVRSVTLFFMGGVTEATREPRRAIDEFVIVGIGPFISLVLAAAFGLIYLAVLGVPVLAAVAGYLAWTNLALAVFNVLPGYPLDGGRLLRSVLWAMTGRQHRATRWAARVGQAFAFALASLGVWAFTQDPGGLNGIWEAAVAFFLFRGATAAHRHARRRERLGTQSLQEVLDRHPQARAPMPLDPSMSLVDAVVVLRDQPTTLWPVGTPLQGAVTLARLEAVDRQDWRLRTVADVSYPAAQVAADIDEQPDTLLERLDAAPQQQLVITRDGVAAGVLTPAMLGFGEV